MNLRGSVLALGLSMSLSACGTEAAARPEDAALGAPPTPDQWRAIGGRTILFGHQSVGRNILDGVDLLMAESGGAPLRVLSTMPNGAPLETGLLEFAVGENGHPASKAADFIRMVDRTAPGPGAIVMYKHCYLDVDARTDPAAMFEQYAAGMRDLRRRHPAVTIVHATVPLTTVESAPERLARALLGRTTRLELNARRNHFNRLLHEAYAGREPIFDLARIESTRPDGSRSFVVTGSDTVFTLAPDWTDDGGHLNPAGARRAAAELLTLFARL